MTSRTAARLNLWIARAAALGVLVSAVIIAVSAVAERPIPDLGLLTLPAVVLLVVGQAWAMAIQSARHLRAEWRKRGTMYFAGLSSRTNTAVMAVVAVGVLAFGTAFLFLGKGGPDPATRSCWPLDSHGVITCVSHSTYLRAGAAQERSVAGILMVFFVIHFAFARSELNRRRRPTDTPDGA